MVDVLEKRLGDLVRELEVQRDQFRRELDKVNAQLDLLSGLVKGDVRPSRTGSVASSPAKSKSTKQAAPKKRGRPKKNKKADGKTEKSAAPAKTTKRGRPAKSKAAVKIRSTAKTTFVAPKTERTLKEELLAIAKSNGGMFRIRDAARALVKAGRYDTNERAGANIQAAIKYYTENFSKEGSERGLYFAKA